MRFIAKQSKNVSIKTLSALERYKFMTKQMRATMAANPKIAYSYADEVLRGRFEAGEAAIATDPQWAYKYAKEIIKGPWPAGEAGILKDPDRAVNYAFHILKKRWPEAEKALLTVTNLFFAFCYVRKFKLRLPEVEKVFSKSAEYSFKYAREILVGPFPAGEKAIATDPELSYFYAIRVLGGKRFPAGEAAIATDSNNSVLYAAMLGKRFPAGEARILQNGNSTLQYIDYVIKGPWPEAEPTILRNIDFSYLYAKKYLKLPEAQAATWRRDSLTTVLRPPV